MRVCTCECLQGSLSAVAVGPDVGTVAAPLAFAATTGTITVEAVPLGPLLPPSALSTVSAVHTVVDDEPLQMERPRARAVEEMAPPPPPVVTPAMQWPPPPPPPTQIPISHLADAPSTRYRASSLIANYVPLPTRPQVNVFVLCLATLYFLLVLVLLRALPSYLALPLPLLFVIVWRKENPRLAEKVAILADLPFLQDDHGFKSD